MLKKIPWYVASDNLSFLKNNFLELSGDTDSVLSLYFGCVVVEQYYLENTYSEYA